MAKVKDQIYNWWDASYTDASGWTHYNIEMLRHAITMSYPSPLLNPTGIVRRSPITSHPPNRGPGSTDQKPYRDCFNECVARWNALPDYCPVCADCRGETSKDAVNAGKSEQGVMCSAFDLFMGCCLSNCLVVEVSGEDGIVFKEGWIPPFINCWSCPSPCKDSVLSIGYTTGQMKVGEYQGLWAIDSACGPATVCCPADEVTWELISGGGSLSSDHGYAVTYYAPGDIEGCTENPTIEVKDCCERSASVTLAVSKELVYQAYAVKTTCWMTRVIGLCSCYCGGVWPDNDDRYDLYDCLGEFIAKSSTISCADPPFVCGPEEAGKPCEADTCPSIIDLRTEEQIAEGCCPLVFA